MTDNLPSKPLDNKLKRTLWTPEILATELLKYTSRVSLQKHNASAYNAAARLGILDDLCSHMEKRREPWTVAELTTEARKYKRRGDFASGSGGAYVSAWSRGILDTICGHMPKPKDWNPESIHTEALKYSARSEFERENLSAYDAARRLGITDKVCSHMTYLVTDWTYEKIVEAAKEFKYRADFQKKNSKAYQAAKFRGIVDEVCSHMEVRIVRWTLDMLQQEALKYKTRSQFVYNSQNAYSHAHRNGLLDTICGHMESISRGYCPDKEGYFYVVDLSSRHDDYLGFGITSQPYIRFKEHIKSCNAVNFNFSPKHITKFADGKVPQLLERHLKQTLTTAKTGVMGFKGEAVRAENAASFYHEIEAFFKTNDLHNTVAEDAQEYYT